MPHARPLRNALLANALFASATGSFILIAPATVTGLLGVAHHPLLTAIGVGLVVFALDLTHQATRRRISTWRAAYATVLDLAWVAGTVVVLATHQHWFTTAGVAIIAAVGALVLGFAILQGRGIDDAHRVPLSRLRQHCVRVHVDRPAASMWQVIADLGAIQRYMPSLAYSAIEAGTEPGRGAVRTCVDRGGRSWSEECIAFEPNSLALRFKTEAAGFPFPASEMYGGWTVEPDGSGGSHVTVWWMLRPRPSVITVLLMPIFGFRADREITNVVRRMAADAHTHSDVRRHAAAFAPPRVRVHERHCRPAMGLDDARSQLA
ncbi:hypothetical protein BH23DEI1_BH23DEI1_23410 [soil metagenome]